MKKFLFCISFLAIRINCWDNVRFNFEELRQAVLTDLNNHLNQYDINLKELIRDFETKYKTYETQKEVLSLVSRHIENEFYKKLKEDFKKIQYKKPDDSNVNDLLNELDEFFNNFNEMNGSLFVRRNVEFFNFLETHYPKLIEENEKLKIYIQQFRNKFIDPLENNIVIVQRMEEK